jgi:WD40 repeat protein
VLVLKTRRQKIEQVLFSPSGRGLAAIGNCGAFWWDDVQVRAATQIERENCFSAAFDLSGKFLVFGLWMQNRQVGTNTHFGPTIRIYSLTQGSFQPVDEQVRGTCLTPSPTEQAFIASSLNTLDYYRLSENGISTLAWSARCEGQISAPIFHSDGSTLVHYYFPGWGSARGSYDLVWRQSNSGESIRVESIDEFPWSRIAISPDSRYLAAPLGDSIQVRILSPGLRAVSRLQNESRKHFTDLAFHPSGRYLAATSNDTTVKFYDTESWQVAKSFTWNVGRLRSIAFSPDGTLAAVGSDSGKIVVWDVDL